MYVVRVTGGAKLKLNEVAGSERSPGGKLYILLLLPVTDQFLIRAYSCC